MNKYSYNFSGLEESMDQLRIKQDTSTLRNIQKELNKFFKDSKCEEVIYTRNTDKLFFGMTTYAVMSDSVINKILTDDEPIRIDKYYIEIDSKLIDLGFSAKELTAIILHEVGHLVNDTTPIQQAREAIDVYMENNGDNVSLSHTYQFNVLLGLAIRDSIRKLTSLFNRKDEEILADEFVFMCGYGNELESAYGKIVSSSCHINKNVANKLIVLDWILKIYKNMKTYRMVALKTLNKSKELTGSKLEKREIDDAIKSVKRVDDNIVRECYTIGNRIVVEGNLTLVEEDGSSKKGFINKLQYKGLRGLEEDVYEYQMRLNNIETQEDAIHLMRQINARMSIIDDFLTYSSEDVSDKERARWEKCLNKYDLLREDLAKKAIYNKKNYGLWYDYNLIDR